MSDIVILKEMIISTATVSLENHHAKKKVVLKEPPPANYDVIIYGMPEDDEVIVIKADSFKAPNGIFSGSKGECKRADFIVVSETDEKKIIIFIELKGGKGGTEIEIIQQLKGAKCFVTYCQEIGKVFWNHQNFLNGYMYRFVSIRNISIPKRPTRPLTPRDVHDRPDKMLKLSSPKGLQFNHLVGEHKKG